MRAVLCRELSGPDALVIEELPAPRCGPNQVRIDVKASGLNYVDALFTQGRYQIKPPLPFIPGSEVAGVVAQVGDEVEGLGIGDRVSASIGLGGYADQIVADPSQVVRIPDQMSFGQAATMVQSYATAWYALTERTAVEADEWVLVLGAAGGVGLACIDVAKALGARVIAAASTDEKLALCTERGADETINYSTAELKDRARELSGGGTDVVVDPVGGEVSEQALRSLGTGGRLMVIGFASCDIPSLSANQILLRNRNVIGVDWGAWAMSNPQTNRSMIEEIFAAVERGSLNPIEPETYPLDSVADALKAMLERRIAGKACLVP